MSDIDVGYEILSCPTCFWVGSPRPKVRKWVLPCSVCGATELVLSDLAPVNARAVTAYGRPANQPEGDPHDHFGGVAADRVPGNPRPGARASETPAPAPTVHPDDDGEISIGPLLEEVNE